MTAGADTDLRWHLIGHVLLDKNSHLKTVVNKTANISDRFRVFPMEVVAGEGEASAPALTSVSTASPGARWRAKKKPLNNPVARRST